MALDTKLLEDFHWLIDVLQHIDVGLVTLDRTFKVHLWNAFMQNHSARSSDQIVGKSIFDCFPELPEKWFRRKIQTVFELENQAFTTWEQRPFLFRFKNYRPITGIAEFMYQNSTIIPLKNARGEVEQVCMIIYDVTETAINKLQIQAANRQLKELSRIDGLTGLLNRKTWEHELELEFQRFTRHRHTTSLLMFDIDHFKPINDTHGHTAGDEVIRQTARILKRNLRNIDVAGRYGGEEFAVLLIDTDARGALTVAERIRREMEKNTVFHEQAEIKYTVSLGIAEINADITDKTHWIDCADKGLYQAKNSGRNKSVIYTVS